MNHRDYAWEQSGRTHGARFGVLTEYIDKLSSADSSGEWIVDTINNGTRERPLQLPYVRYSDLAIAFEKEFYRFSESHPEFELTHYQETLEKNGVVRGGQELRSAHLNSLDAQGILALIMGVIRADRFSEGTLLDFLKDGTITNWLKRLRDIDSQQHGRHVAKS